jgi:hypothetical protein
MTRLSRQVGFYYPGLVVELLRFLLITKICGAASEKTSSMT